MKNALTKIVTILIGWLPALLSALLDWIKTGNETKSLREQVTALEQEMSRLKDAFATSEAERDNLRRKVIGQGTGADALDALRGTP